MSTLYFPDYPQLQFILLWFEAALGDKKTLHFQDPCSCFTTPLFRSRTCPSILPSKFMLKRGLSYTDKEVRHHFMDKWTASIIDRHNAVNCEKISQAKRNSHILVETTLAVGFSIVFSTVSSTFFGSFPIMCAWKEIPNHTSAFRVRMSQTEPQRVCTADDAE